MAAVYQEQLTQAAEQLRLLRRMVFGQRRERYTTTPVPRVTTARRWSPPNGHRRRWRRAPSGRVSWLGW
jgi:hypothetical protein